MVEPSTFPQQPGRPSPFAFAASMPNGTPLTEQQRITTLLAPIEAVNVIAQDIPAYTDWDRCLAQFLRATFERSQSSGSLIQYADTIYRFFTGMHGLLSVKHPEDYTYDDINAFIHAHSRHGKPIAPGTRNGRLAILSAFYTFASKYTIPGEHGRPTLLTQAPRPTDMFDAIPTTKNYKAFTDSEIRKLFAVIPRDTVIGLRDRAMFLFFFYTGRRLSEVMRLTWRDLEYGTITNEDGSSHEGWLYHFKGKGHSAIDDSAELPTPAKDALDAYHATIGIKDSIAPGDALFYAHYLQSQDGPVRLFGQFKARSVSHQLRFYMDKASIYRPGLSVHSFRHYFAQKHYLILHDARAVQRLLRHKSLKTTGDYLDILMTSGDMAAARIEEEYRGL